MANYGVLGSDNRLSAVSVDEIARRSTGRTCAAKTTVTAPVETYMIGAMSPEHALRYFQLTTNKVVIVGGDRAEVILTALDTPTVGDRAHRQLRARAPPCLAVPRDAVCRSSRSSSDTVTAADGLRRLFGRLRVKERSKIDLIADIVD